MYTWLTLCAVWHLGKLFMFDKKKTVLLIFRLTVRGTRLSDINYTVNIR